MEDRMNDYEGFDIHQFSVELKEGESLCQVTIEFPDGTENVIIVREREMKVLTAILLYNRYSYTVDSLM